MSASGRILPTPLDHRSHFEVSVPPQQQIALVFGDFGAYPLPPAPFAYSATSSLPDGVGFWTAVQVYNGVPIVAERVAAASAYSSPAGVATAAGTPVTAVQHLIAGNWASGAEVALAVVNPSSDSIALVTVSKIADGQVVPIAQLNPLEVAPPQSSAGASGPADRRRLLRIAGGGQPAGGRGPLAAGSDGHRIRLRGRCPLRSVAARSFCVLAG